MIENRGIAGLTPFFFRHVYVMFVNRIKQKFGWLLVLVLAIVLPLLLTACDPRTSQPLKGLIEESDRRISKQTDEAIKNDPELQELDRLCTGIPLPSDFVLIRKGDLDDRIVTIGYYYKSDTPYSEARLLWINYFSQNGWEAEKEQDVFPRTLRFKNGSYRASFFNGGLGAAQYSLSCEKL